MRDGNARFVRLRVIGGALVLVCALGTAALAGGGNCLPGVTSCATPTPQPTTEPTPPPEPSSTPSASATPTPVVPNPSQQPVVPTPTPTPKGKATPTPTAAGAKANASLPPGLTQPTFDIPQLARTAPKNTLHLIQELEPLTKF